MDPGTRRGSAKPNDVKQSSGDASGATGGSSDPSAQAQATSASTKPRQKSRRKNTVEDAEADDAAKRRCVSTACIACRRRKSKCDGNTPACAACSQVYRTECIYDPNSDHRRKGVYKSGIDSSGARNSTLHTLIEAILNYPEDDVPALIHEIRTCESLDSVADKIVAKEQGLVVGEAEDQLESHGSRNSAFQPPTFENQLYGKLGDLRLDDGQIRYIGGTSNLIHLTQQNSHEDTDEYSQQEDPITSWTEVTDDPELVVHLLNMYFTWHYTYFTTMSKTMFYRDFLLGKPPDTTRRKTQYCSSLLVNAILALGCHFTSHGGARDIPEDSATAGDHFFKEAKRLIMENDEHEKPKLTTVQALALMSVREAGCGREAKGWVYSGMSFRMACDMGLNLDSGRLTSGKGVNGDEAEEDVRRITFWGCFLFDKCWSNYLGRLPQLPGSMVTVPKVDVFPDEDSTQWSPYSDSGFTQAHAQPARTRAVALEITKLCQISDDLMKYFYNPSDMEKTKGKAVELKKLQDIHTRLEAWRRDLPKEMEPKEGGLSSVLVMHMFFQLLFIHLFRPFLKYTQATSPLPHSVSPRKLCTQAAGMISKLLRLYKRSHGLRQICNIAVYIAHSACTIHLLNLPDKAARRDIVHGVKHLEEIAEGWLCARRTLGVLSVLARQWNVDMPEEAAAVLARTDAKFGDFVGITSPVTPVTPGILHTPLNPSQYAALAAWQDATTIPTPIEYINNVSMPAMGAGGPVTRVRETGAEYAPPPQDADDLRALQYPSAAATPGSGSGRRPHSRESMSMGTRSAASPSDMFGGVDQLIRDSQDWVYRDQAQYATGFENWNSLELEPTSWPNGVVGDTVINGASIGAPPTNGMLMPNVNPAYGLNGVAPGAAASIINAPITNGGAPAGNGGPRTNWLNGTAPYNTMASYNENEWYQ